MDILAKNQISPIGYSIEQTTKILPIGRSSIYKLIKQGEIKTVILCGRRIIPASEINRIIAPANETKKSILDLSILEASNKPLKNNDPREVT